MTSVCVLQKQVERKVCLTAKMLEEKIQEVKGAVMICYPMGLPAWDPMRLILEGQDDGPSSVRPCDELRAKRLRSKYMQHATWSHKGSCTHCAICGCTAMPPPFCAACAVKFRHVCK